MKEVDLPGVWGRSYIAIRQVRTSATKNPLDGISRGRGRVQPPSWLYPGPHPGSNLHGRDFPTPWRAGKGNDLLADGTQKRGDERSSGCYPHVSSWLPAPAHHSSQSHLGRLRTMSIGKSMACERVSRAGIVMYRYTCVARSPTLGFHEPRESTVAREHQQTRLCMYCVECLRIYGMGRLHTTKRDVMAMGSSASFRENLRRTTSTSQ